MTPSDALVYLNNLTSSMRKKEIAIGPSLCHAGIYYASKALVLPAVRVYLHITAEQSYPPNWRTEYAMERLCARLRHEPPIHTRTWGAWRVGDWRRRDVLSLMTGWESGGVQEVGEKRKACFGTILREDPEMYTKYLLALGALGASEAIWHEWSTVSSPLLNELNWKGRVEAFVTAFLVAKDSHRALMVFNSISEGPVHGLASSSADSKSEPQSQKIKIQEMLLRHCHLHGMSPEVYGWLVEEITKAMSHELHEALPTIERLLEVDWVNTGGEGFHVRKEDLVSDAM